MRRTVLQLTAAAVLAFSAPVPANATVDIGCNEADGGTAEVFLNIGTLSILNILSATIDVDGAVWSTNPGKGETEIIVGQAAQDGNLLIADFTDPNVERIVASLRLLNASAGDDYVTAGTLVITDASAHAMVCLGP